MSNSWETTPDDILNVVHDMGKKVTSDQVGKIMDGLDHFLVEAAALCEVEMEAQTKAAYVEIKRQIAVRNLI